MPEQPRAHQLPRGHFPSTTRGLAKYLQETEGLEREHAVRIVRAVFTFIRVAVLEHGSSFNAFHLGTFSRRLRQRVLHPIMSGPVPMQYVIKFTASHNYGRVRLEDDE